MSDATIPVTALVAAHSRAWLSAVFAAWARGETVTGRADDVPGVTITRTERFAPDPGWFEARLPDCPPGAPALLSFSSGTTGRPKAILLSHGALANVVARINAAMEVDATIREYVGIPVNYSFGFGRIRAIAAAGGRAFLPDHGFDPGEIGQMLAAGEINAVSAVPTLWRVLLANSDAIPDAARAKLRWIEIGSQWMSGEEKLALREMFPEAKIVQHYGLTEASRTALLDISDAPVERLGSVGQAMGEVEIAIGEGGRIRTRGPHLATGLVTADGTTPVTGPDGWLTTTDLGRIEDGWLYYEGRADEIVNAGGIKIDPTAFEQKLGEALDRPGVVAAGRIPDALRGEKVLVVYKTGTGLARVQVETAAAQVASDFGLPARGAVKLREVTEIPLTPTGKVRRKDLSELADLGASEVSQTDPPPPAGTTRADLHRLWAELLGRDDVPLDQSFHDLGGDSLSSMTAVMRMEEMGFDPEIARGIFQGRSIAEIVPETGGEGGGFVPEPAEAGRATRQGERIDHASARVFCTLLVVLYHVVGTPNNGLELPPDHWAYLVSNAFKPLRLPMFVFLAGFSFATIAQQIVTSRVAVSGFSEAVARSLILPAAISLAIFAAVSTLLGTSFAIDSPGAALSLLWDPYAHYWFIMALTLILATAVLLVRQVGVLWMALILLLVPLPVPQIVHEPNIWAKNQALGLMPLFAAGLLFALNLDRVMRHARLLLALAAALTVMFFALDLDIPWPKKEFAPLPVSLSMIALCLAFARYIPGLRRLAPYAFFIYLWHVFGTSGTRRLLEAAGVENVGLHLVAGLLGGVLVPLLLYHLAGLLPGQVRRAIRGT